MGGLEFCQHGDGGKDVSTVVDFDLRPNSQGVHAKGEGVGRCLLLPQEAGSQAEFHILEDTIPYNGIVRYRAWAVGL